jgi:hypothetical protein
LFFVSAETGENSNYPSQLQCFIKDVEPGIIQSNCVVQPNGTASCGCAEGYELTTEKYCRGN